MHDQSLLHALRARLLEFRLPETPLRLRLANSNLLIVTFLSAMLVLGSVLLSADVPQRLYRASVLLLVASAISNGMLAAAEWQRSAYDKQQAGRSKVNAPSE